MSIYCYFGGKRETFGRSSQPSLCLSWLNYRDYSDVKNDVIPKTFFFLPLEIEVSINQELPQLSHPHFFLTLKPWKLITWRRICSSIQGIPGKNKKHCSWVQLPGILFNLLPFVLHLVDQFEVKNHLFIVVIVLKNIHLHVYTRVRRYSINSLSHPPFFFASNQGIYDSVEADKEPLPGHWEEFLGVFEWALPWCYNQNFWNNPPRQIWKELPLK